MTRRLDSARSELVNRLSDARGRRVVFLAHCLLNENTRYLGGACRAACVQEILAQCVDRGLGIVQLPCPEELAWGGVLKRHLLRAYGSAVVHPRAWRLARTLLPVALARTRQVYERIARQVAAQISDYVASGIDVVAIVGIDGSPSCGVDSTLDPAACLDEIARIPTASMTVERQNALIRELTGPGQGLFVAALRGELSRRRLDVPFVGHDLLRELGGGRSNVDLVAIGRRPRVTGKGG
jgi:predicted secreted protein